MNKKLIKGLIPGVVFVMVLTFTIGQARADFMSANTSTGYNSDNTSTSKNSNDSAVLNSNSQLIVNVAGVTSETGDNSSKENTGSGSVTSGNQGIMGGFDTQANLSMTDLMGQWFADFFSLNNMTGAESDNSAVTELKNESAVANDNTLTAHNFTMVNAESGDNKADENTGTGRVMSGNIGVMSLDTTVANGIGVDTTGTVATDTTPLFTATAANDTTGAESDNSTKIKVSNELDILNSNYAEIGNMTDISAKTGHNSASENTGMATITSGTATTSVGILNNVNMVSNMISINPTGGDISALNSTTGHESDNSAKAEVKNEVELSNLGSTDISNDVKVKLDTGDNKANGNTGNASITSGPAASAVAITNGSGSANNATQINIDLSQLDVTVGNATTGAESDNDAQAKFSNNVAVDNANTTDIGNKVKVSENTGGNSASENTGSGGEGATGMITSGSAMSQVMIDNQVNANTTAVNFNPAVTMSAINQKTGADSDNSAKAEVKNNIDVTNTNNSAISNCVSTNLNTGDNKTNENTGSGTVNSGSATVMFGVSNTTNGNSTQVGQ